MTTITLLLDLDGPIGPADYWQDEDATATAGLPTVRHTLTWASDGTVTDDTGTPVAGTPPGLAFTASDDPAYTNTPRRLWIAERFSNVRRNPPPYALQLLTANGATQRLGDLRLAAIGAAPPDPTVQYLPRAEWLTANGFAHPDGTTIVQAEDGTLSAVAGAGVGALLAENNLSDVADGPTALATIGGVTAAFVAGQIEDFGAYVDDQLAAEALARTTADNAHAALTTTAHGGIVPSSALGVTVATLDGGGKVPSNQIPAVAITDTFTVASQAAMLALTAQRGDVAIRTDLNDTFILTADDPTLLSNWAELRSPTDGVTAVTGTGNIASTGGTTPQLSFTGTLPVANGGTGATTGAEPPLGNPASNGYVLSSTTGGTRSWVAQSGSGGTHAPVIIVAADDTGDYTTIAAALAVVPAGGAIVAVKCGTYTLTAALSIPANTTLQGEGPATIIQAPLSATDPALTVAADDVTLRDFAVDGRRASQTPATLTQTNFTGISVSAGARLRVQRVAVSNTLNHGIVIQYPATDPSIQDCRITNLSTDPAGHVGETAFVGLFCLGVMRPVIRGCTINGWAQAIGLWSANAANPTSDAVVDGNYLLNNYGYVTSNHVNGTRSALEDYGSTVTTHGRNRITNNVIDGSTSYCLEIAQGVHGSIYANNILKNFGIVDGSAGQAIGVGSGFMVAGQTGTPTQETEDVLIIGNRIYSPSGADRYCGIGGLVRRVTVRDNLFYNFTGSNGPLVITGQSSPELADAVLIQGNQFYGCQRGVFVNGGADGCIIRDNIFRSSVDGNPVIYLGYGNGHLVAGNDVESLGTLTLQTAAGSRHRILANRISSAKAGGTVASFATADTLVEGNEFIELATSFSSIVGATNAARLILQRNHLRTPNYGGAWHALTLLGTTDYAVVQDNRLDAHDVSDQSTGTHNKIEPNHSATVTRALNLKTLGSQTVGTSQATIAHSLGYAPTQVVVMMTSAGNIYKSASSDSTNIYLTADASGRTAEIYVR